MNFEAEAGVRYVTSLRVVGQRRWRYRRVRSLGSRQSVICRKTGFVRTVPVLLRKLWPLVGPSRRSGGGHRLPCFELSLHGSGRRFQLGISRGLAGPDRVQNGHLRKRPAEHRRRAVVHRQPGWSARLPCRPVSTARVLPELRDSRVKPIGGVRAPHRKLTVDRSGRACPVPLAKGIGYVLGVHRGRPRGPPRRLEPDFGEPGQAKRVAMASTACTTRSVLSKSIVVGQRSSGWWNQRLLPSSDT